MKRGISANALLAGLLAFAALLTASPGRSAPIQIVAFGDSITFGKGIARNETYPAQLEAALRAKGHDVRIRNAGVNGDTTARARARVGSAVPAGTQIAIVLFGINDVRAGVDRGMIEANIDAVVRQLRARKIEVLLIGHRGGDLARVAAAHGAAYMPWPGRMAVYQLPGDTHLNATGYGVLVASILPQLEPLLARVRR